MSAALFILVVVFFILVVIVTAIVKINQAPLERRISQLETTITRLQLQLTRLLNRDAAAPLEAAPLATPAAQPTPAAPARPPLAEPQPVQSPLTLRPDSEREPLRPPPIPAATALPASSPAIEAIDDIADEAATTKQHTELPAWAGGDQEIEPALLARDTAEPTPDSPSQPDAGAAFRPPPIPPIRQSRPFQPSPVQHQPDGVERLITAARDWLLGGNVWVRVAVVVLFFAVGFLLKYSADHNMLPIELRLAGVALAATALLVIGWRIGDQRGAYGLVLQGGGIGMLYMTVFTAARIYHLLPSAMALPLMVAVCGLSAFLAVRQNAQVLAFMGSAGGFLAPLLLATSGGNHVALFSYYAVLNAGILAIAWFKAWRPLNLLGFLFTFAIGALWGMGAYRPSMRASVEAFLILFFLMYVGIALLYALQRQITLKHYVDGTLVFGTPIAAIGLQTALMKDVKFGLAWSAVALAAFYFGVAATLIKRRNRIGLMFDAMLALGVIFATLTIPLAFSGLTTSAAWAVESAAVLWMAVRQRSALQLAFALVMQFAAAAAFSFGVAHASDGLPFFNTTLLASLMIALSALFSGWWLQSSTARHWRPASLPRIGLVMAAWGLFWWIGAGNREILAYGDTVTENQGGFILSAYVLFALLTAALAHLLHRRLDWPFALWTERALPFVLAVLALFAVLPRTAPMSDLGMVAWPAAAILSFILLFRQERDVALAKIEPSHTTLFWTFGIILALEGYWRLRLFVPEGAWSWSAWAYGLGGLLLLVAGPGARLTWPIGRFPRGYLEWGATPLVALLWLWSIASLSSDGDASPLTWLPILNPLDIAQCLVFLTIAVWLHQLNRINPNWRNTAFDYIALATVFLWFNAVLLRTFHHWAGLPYNLYDLSHSMVVQASISVFWTTCAFAIMAWATHRAIRTYWLIGSTLLAVTVVKLFLFDLSHLQDIVRIVALISIALIMLLIGYVTPLPPKAGETGNDAGETGKKQPARAAAQPGGGES